MSDHRRAMLLMAAFAVLFAAIEAVAAHVLHRYSPYQVVWTRYAVHLALMLAVWGWREPASLWRTRRPGFQVLRSLLMLGMPAAWVTGVALGVDHATVMAVFWSSPLMIMALGALVLKERVPGIAWAAALAALAGAWVLHPPGRLEPLHLLAFPLAMALCFSAYVVMTRCLRGESTRANLFYTALGVMLALAPAMPALWIVPTPADLAVMVAVGVIGYVGLLALDRMAHAGPVSVSAPFAYLQLPVFAALAAASSGAWQSPQRAALGAALVGAACLFLWARESRHPLTEAPAGAIR